MSVALSLPDFDEASLPRALPDDEGGPRGSVLWRVDEDDFRVDELPAYLPAGSGEHLYLRIEKRGISTPDLVRRLGRRFGLDEREIGYAGMKDAHGVTTQWVSVPARKVEPEVSAVDEIGPVRVLEASRHGNKLRLGHNRGNRFTVRLRGDVDVDFLRRRAAALALGVPNAFGAQRFGPHNQSLREAERFVARARPARTRKEKLLASVAQSALFNAWLKLRCEAGTWLSALDGDVLMKSENGAPFVSTDPPTDTARIARGEVSVSGPMFGARMRSAEREALTWESRSFEGTGVDRETWMAHPAFDVGARRVARVWADAIDVTPAEGGAAVAFSLPSGAYASVFLRNWVGAALVDPVFADPGEAAGPPQPT